MSSVIHLFIQLIMCPQTEMQLTTSFFLFQLFLLVTLVQCNFTVGTRNSLSLLTSVCSLRLRLNLGMHLDLVHGQNFSKPLTNLNISSFLCHSCNSYRIRRVRKPGDTSKKYYEVRVPGHFFPFVLLFGSELVLIPKCVLWPKQSGHIKYLNIAW